MTPAWMLYTLAVTSLLSLAALVAEQAMRARRQTTRWIWALALAGSVVLPWAMPSLSLSLQQGGHGGAPARNLTAITLTPSPWRPAPATSPIAAPGSRGNDAFYDPLLPPRVAPVLSLGMLAWLGMGALLLQRRRRAWSAGHLLGVPVLISDDAGPAVVGLLRPRIVVPAWLLHLSGRQQALVLAHEQSHLAARDPLLLALALLLLVAMPWNLPLWWQLRRLRHAVEVDCDARVLAAGHAVRDYGAVLIEVARRRSSFMWATAMAESGALLEQRMAIMLRPPRRWLRRLAPVLALLALGTVALAAQLGPPPATPRAVPLADELLARYVGYYQISPSEVMVISQGKNVLLANWNLERRLRLLPEGGDRFFADNNTISVRFIPGAPGAPAAALVLRQLGVDYPAAPRVGAEAVQRADDLIARRVAAQRPAPGGAQLLRRAIELARQGRMERSDFSPEFGQVVERELPRLQAQARQLGPLRSLEFQRVDAAGWDVYRVTFQHATVEAHLWLDASGRVSKYFGKKLG